MTSSTTRIDNYDLTTESGVKAYLDDTPFASHTIITLSGGSANYTYRIRLVTPHEGQSTLVLKHAEPYVKGSTIPFSLERQVWIPFQLQRWQACDLVFLAFQEIRSRSDDPCQGVAIPRRRGDDPDGL